MTGIEQFHRKRVTRQSEASTDQAQSSNGIQSVCGISSVSSWCVQRGTVALTIEAEEGESDEDPSPDEEGAAQSDHLLESVHPLPGLRETPGEPPGKTKGTFNAVAKILVLLKFSLVQQPSFIRFRN